MYETEEDFDRYYVLKVSTPRGMLYYFRPNVYVADVGLARKFNTIRSVRRSIKLGEIECYEIETHHRKNETHD